MSTANRVVKNTGILYAKMGITIIISLYTTRLLLMSLGVNDFGVFNLVGGAIAMLTFLNSAMTAATQRFMSFSQGTGDQNRQRAIFNVSLCLHLLIAVAVLILLEVIGYFLFKDVFKISADRIESAKMVYQFMTVSTFFTIISVPYDALINAHENMLLYSVLGIIESITKLGIVIYLSHTNFDRLVIYGFLVAMLSITLLLIRLIYCRIKYSESKINVNKHFDRATFFDLTKFASWSFLGASTSMLSNYGQAIVINMFFGPIVNTAQSISGQVSGQLGVFALTMQKALNPVIDKSEGAGDRSLMLSAAIVGSKVSFFLLMLFYVPMLIEMPFIFKLWLKNVPEYAVLFCRLLLFRNLIEQLFLTLNSAIYAVGNIKKYQIYTSLLNLLPLLISYLFFKWGYPPYALYVIFIFYSIISSTVILYFAKTLCNLDVLSYSRNVIYRCVFVFCGVFIFASVPYLLMTPQLIRLVLIVGINLFTFGILTWYFGFSSIEKVSVKGIIQAIIKRIALLLSLKLKTQVIK